MWFEIAKWAVDGLVRNCDNLEIENAINRPKFTVRWPARHYFKEEY